MAASPIGTILEMIWTLISSTVSTTGKLGSLFFELTGQLGSVSTLGPAGFLLAGIVLVAVIFFLAKFVLGAGKNLLILLIVGFLIMMAMLFAV